jgi:hypothetical protein
VVLGLPAEMITEATPLASAPTAVAVLWVGLWVGLAFVALIASAPESHAVVEEALHPLIGRAWVETWAESWAEA